MYLCDDKNELNKKVRFKIKKQHFVSEMRNEINKMIDFCINYIIMKSIT